MLIQEFECITCLKMYEDSETAIILECDECKNKAHEQELMNIREAVLREQVDRFNPQYLPTQQLIWTDIHTGRTWTQYDNIYRELEYNTAAGFFQDQGETLGQNG